ncbi:MAG: serine hydrolase [Desulfotomaculales bacterium]
MVPARFFVKILFAFFVFFFSGSASAAAQSGPDYSSLEKAIREFTAKKSTTYGIYFQDLGSGKSFGLNDEEPMVAASTIKFPMSLYLYTLAAEGKLDWNARVAYQKMTDYEGGDGILRYTAREGERYSLRALNTLSLVTSDNIAFRMLARHVGRENFVSFLRELGGRTVYPGGKNITTAKDLGVYLQAVLDFVRRHPEEGKRLLDDLANSIYHTGLPGLLPESVVVAHKEGDLDEGVANDAGVVFSSRPYILVVLSAGVNNLEEGFADIARISKMVYDYQEKLASRQ